MFCVRSYIAIASVLMSSVTALAQTRVPVVSPTQGQTQRATIDDAPYSSTRGPALGGTHGAVLSDSSSELFQPAGIGGINSKNSSLVRQFHFPYIGVEFNSSSQTFMNDTARAGTAGPTEYSSAVNDAIETNEGRYARQSVAPHFTLGRMVFVPFVDQQIAAAPIYDSATEAELLHQVRSGVGAGISLREPSDMLYLGVFASYSQLKRTSGIFDQRSIAEMTSSADYDDFSKTYKGMDINFGALIRFTKKNPYPTISLTARHLGNTKYIDSEDEALVEPQDLGLMMNLSPTLGKYMQIHTGLGAVRIDDSEIDFVEKLRFYCDASIFGHSEDAPITLQLGGQSFGATYGAQVNAGFLSFQYADYPVNLAVSSKDPNVERRQSIVFIVDLAHP